VGITAGSEKYQEEKACDKRHPYRIIIIIIIRKSDNNRGNWNHFKITQTIPEQNTGAARN